MLFYQFVIKIKANPAEMICLYKCFDGITIKTFCLEFYGSITHNKARAFYIHFGIAGVFEKLHSCLMKEC